MKTSNTLFLDLPCYGDLDVWFGKLRPDSQPVSRSQFLAGDFALCLLLDTNARFRVRVADVVRPLPNLSFTHAHAFSKSGLSAVQFDAVVFEVHSQIIANAIYVVNSNCYEFLVIL